MASNPSRTRLFLPTIAASLLPLSFVGCGGLGGGSNSSSSFAVVSCSLGGSPCGGASNVVNQNQDLKFTFNSSVSAVSVTSETLGVVTVDPSGGGGSEPPGSRFVQGNVVTFRPAVSIDSNGNVIYGLTPGKSYKITIPKAPNTSIQSTGNDPNTAEVSTTVFVANLVVDAVPGNPQIKGKALLEPADLQNAPNNTSISFTFTDIMNVSTLLNTTSGQSQSMSVRVDLDGNPATPNDQIPINGTWSVNFDTVAQETTVRFNLIPGTQFPGPGPSDSRRVVVVLQPSVIKDLGGNPLATGIDPKDGLENPTQFVFKIESQACPPPVDLIEDFAGNGNEDASNTGLNMWNSAGNGMLVAGVGGGSGTHGEFVADFTMDFNSVGSIATDGTTLPATSVSTAVSIPGRFPYVVKDVDSLTGQSVTVNDGIFQFSKFSIPNGLRVRFDGTMPARIFVRGAVQIDGVLDVAGLDGSLNSSVNERKAFAGINTPCVGPAGNDAWDDPGGDPCPTFPQYLFGKPGGRGGPVGGDGGNGGDLPVNTPAYPPGSAALFKSFHGANGNAAPAFPGDAGPVAAGGTGTRAVPINLVGPTLKEVFGNVNDVGVGGGFTFDNCTASGCANPNPNLADGMTWFGTGTSPNSVAIHIGAPGGGGASYGTDGRPGVWCNETVVTPTCSAKLAAFPFANLTVPLVPPPKTDADPYWPLPPIGVPGAKAVPSDIPNFGDDGLGNFAMLPGAAGGGGGGANCNGTTSQVSAPVPLTWSSNGTISGIICIGAAGGGGGGALQLQAGRSIAVTKVTGIDGTGGDGGDHIDRPNSSTGGTCTPFPQCSVFPGGALYGEGMCPGGAGGGGSILLQCAGTVTLVNGAVSVRPGNGGDGRLMEVGFNSKFILNAGTYPGYNTTLRLRLRGGDGGVGRWHYQTANGQNLDAGFDPVQAANQSSLYTGINIAAADFSGAESKWITVPASGVFTEVSSYTLTIAEDDGQGGQTLTDLLQDDVNNNEVLTNSFFAGGTMPVRLLFQGTRADAFNQPDPSQRTRWTDKVTELSSSSPKFIRFIVIFSRAASVANPVFLGIDKISMKVSGC